MKIWSVTIFILFFSFFLNAQKPKLIVGIVVDQMCYDYLYRFQKNFSKNGFNRFINHGVNFRNTLYNYVPTYTGPGHASIYTGTTPSNHGIIGNEWFDKETQRIINCVADENYQSIGTNSIEGKCSPKSLKTYTVTDQLKLSSPKSKVFSFSIKDRGAILPGGHLSDGTYWFDYSSGKFISSNFYSSKLPIWVSEFNEKNNAKSYTKSWNLLLSEDRYSSVDESPYEVVIPGKKEAVFPYDFPNLANSDFLFTLSPFANSLLTDLAIEAVLKEQLGKDVTADFLAVSFSTPDIAGHAFGPYSREIEDMYYRLDLELARFIDVLEQQVGKNNFVIFLTADHAVLPVPQQLEDKNLPGGYIYMDEISKEIQNAFLKNFGKVGDWILEEQNQQYYLNEAQIKEDGISISEISQTVKNILLNWKGIKAVYSKSELTMEIGVEDEWKSMVRKGYDYKRSGDLAFILEPGYLTKSTDSPSAHLGTSHGSSFNYDTHVPLLWYGYKFKKQDIFTPCEIIDIAPTLIHLLNLQLPGAMTGKPLTELLKK